MQQHFYEVNAKNYVYLLDAIKEQSREMNRTGIRPVIIEHFEDGTICPMPLEDPQIFIGTAADELDRLAREEWNQ